jgi:hypothetical protein
MTAVDPLPMSLNREECQHKQIWFGSGDYYVFCHACGAKWVMHGADRPEYGEREDGTKIGGAPELSNKAKPYFDQSEPRILADVAAGQVRGG